MVTINFLFDDAADYTFDSDKIEINGGKAKLKLIDNPGNIFTEDFTDDTE